MKYTMTLDDYNYLKRFDRNFETVANGYSAPIASIHLRRFKEVLEKESGYAFYLNSSCSTCIMNLLKRLKPYYEAARDEFEKAVEEVSTVEEIKPKGKGGRPKGSKNKK